MSQVSDNPFKFSDTNKRYYTYDYYLRHTYGEKCAKITLDCGFTCPNIDGARGFGGCIYCHSGSAAPTGRVLRGKTDTSPYEIEKIHRQYVDGIAMIRKKWDVKKFIPYLQAYTNTYTSAEKLRHLLDAVSLFENAAEICIATRADCLEGEKIKIIDTLSKKIPVSVELGLQSSNDKTAKKINRCHTYAEFEDGFGRLRLGAPEVKIGIHIIDGLPGETLEDMENTAKSVALLHPDSVKIHLLYVTEGTALARMYESGEYTPMAREDYIQAVCNQLELLPPDTVIERLTGDAEATHLIAPLWSVKKVSVINDIDKELFTRGSYQGKRYER